MRQGLLARRANWLLAREGRAIQFGSFTGDRVVGSVRVVPALNWVVVAEIPTTRHSARWHDCATSRWASSPLLLAVVGALAYLLSLPDRGGPSTADAGRGEGAKGDLDVGLSVTTAAKSAT